MIDHKALTASQEWRKLREEDVLRSAQMMTVRARSLQAVVRIEEHEFAAGCGSSARASQSSRCAARWFGGKPSNVNTSSKNCVPRGSTVLSRTLATSRLPFRQISARTS